MEKTALPRKIETVLEKFILVLENVYGPGLRSVILYGSALNSDFSERFSNVNLLVVLDDTSLPNLKKISAALKKPVFRLIEPLFLTQEYIRHSLDVFPIEFLDILENHRLLLGADILQCLSVDPANLRFQCEQELKAKLVRLQSVYIRTQTKAGLETLLVRSFNSYIHIVRNLMRLKGVKPAYPKQEAIREFKAGFAITTDVLDRLLDLKMKNAKLSYAQLESLLFDFVRELELITKAVDEI